MKPFSRFVAWLKRLGDARPQPEEDKTEEFATLSSFTLLPGKLKLRVGVVSVTGNYREHNEDNFYVPGRRSVRQEGGHDSKAEGASLTLDPPTLFIVADGMGGQQAGEQASLMAVELIPRAIAKRLMPEPCDPARTKEAIREAVAEVNQEILGSSGAVSHFSNMGTTVVLAQYCKDRLFVAGIGDSRAYRLRDGRMEQLTQDHSLADALRIAGTITPEEVPNHKFKNVLYLYLGCKDARNGPEEIRILDVRPGDRLIMASDGLTGWVSDRELARVLGTVDDPQQAAVILKDLALANDSKDNITCLIVHAVAQHEPTASAGASTDSIDPEGGA